MDRTSRLEGIDQVDILLMNYEGLTWFVKQKSEVETEDHNLR